ncbi:MAG: hypothetical protein AB1644_09765 [Candidatus Zixiibacteriota bacterium]
MFIWCAVLFGLGIVAFLDSIFNMGEIFRTVNSVLFLLVSLGLLVRTTTKMKDKKLETKEDRIFNLEKQLGSLKKSQEQLSKF